MLGDRGTTKRERTCPELLRSRGTRDLLIACPTLNELRHHAT